MTQYARPKAGQPAEGWIQSAALWASIVDVVNDYNAGKLGGSGAGAGGNSAKPRLVNTQSTAVEFGQIVQLLSMVTTDANDPIGSLTAPTMNASAPTWHTGIHNVASVRAGAQPGEVIETATGWAVVKINMVSTEDQFVMVDPDTPSQMKTADAGIWKILGKDPNNNYAVVDLHQNQPFWFYKLKTDSVAPSDTPAELRTLANTIFADTIDLSDPYGFMSDQVEGDLGLCFHAGNKFYALQAVC